MLYRVKPVRLNDIYQPLSIKSHKNFQEIIPETTSELFKDSNYVTIIGGAGSGKTTYLKYYFGKVFFEKSFFPIFIELRYLNEYYSFGRLKDYLIEDIFKLNQISEKETITESILNSGKLIFFFDGFDELKKDIRHSVLNDINLLAKVYHKNKYILTSRPYTSADSLPLFHNYRIQDLKEDEVFKFIDRQLIEKEIKEKIKLTIQEKDKIVYQKLLRNPLLLTMFILTFQSYSQLPEKESTFYYQVFDTLYSRHDSESKMGFTREKLSGLSKEKFQVVLESFSFLSFFESVFDFEYEYLFKKLAKIKYQKKIEYDVEKVIEDFTIAIGIIIKDGLVYTFPHRSIQEYFSAKLISGIQKEELKEEAYFKIRENHRTLLNFHFLDLCKEIDTYNYYKFLVLPILESFINQFNAEWIFDAKNEEWLKDATNEEIKEAKKKEKKIMHEIFCYFFEFAEITYYQDSDGQFEAILNSPIFKSPLKANRVSLFSFLLEPFNLTSWIGYSFSDEYSNAEYYLQRNYDDSFYFVDVNIDTIEGKVIEEENLERVGEIDLSNVDVWNILKSTGINDFPYRIYREVQKEIEIIKDELNDYNEQTKNLINLI